MIPEAKENLLYREGKVNQVTMPKALLLRMLPEKPGRLLDIGCGEGGVTINLLNRGFEVMGLDFSAVAVEKAKSRGIDALLWDVDKDGIPFPTRYFDIVWASDVIEHLFDPIYFLQESRRVLKQYGRLLMTTPNYYNLQQNLCNLISGRSIQSNFYRRSRLCKHHTFFSLELLEYMLSEAGLEFVKHQSVINIPWVNKTIITDSRILGARVGIYIIVAVKRQD